MKMRMTIVALVLCLTAMWAAAQDKPIVSPAELITTLDEAKDIGQTAAIFRSRLGDDLAAADFVRELALLQTRAEPLIVLIAQTSPPAEHQRFAMNIAMGLKGVELGLWHYIYGVLSGDAGHVEYADGLFRRAREELSVAGSMSAAIR